MQEAWDKASNTNLRNVNVTIGAKTYGKIEVKSYHKSTRPIFYMVPLYIVWVQGTDDDGNKVAQHFYGLRFGVQNETGDVKDSHVVGLKDAGNYIIKKVLPNYLPHSFPSNEDGAWVIEGTHYIHAGPGFYDYAASIGCVEIQGDGEFVKFNNLIFRLAGLGNSTASNGQKMTMVATAGVLRVTFEQAKRPNLEAFDDKRFH